MKIQQQGVFVSEKQPPYKMNTEEIKSELGNWPQAYYSHRTGKQQFDCTLLFGEKEGVVKWLTDLGIIGKQSEYNFIKKLEEWKRFERKLELWRELQGRSEKAKAYDREAIRQLASSKIVSTNQN